MRFTKRLVQATGLAAGVVAVVAASTPRTPIGRALRDVSRRLARDARYVASSAPGLAYRLAGRRPDPDVSDDILADRIRSTIGPLERRLDVPHVHVMVEDHVAILHGDVAGEADARAIEHAVLMISGVRGVESHLHRGLLAGDTRPSEGLAASYVGSPALQALLDAARGAGAQQPNAAVHAVLCAFMERIPEGERADVLAHLPDDVRSLAGVRRHGTPARIKTLEELVRAAGEAGGLDPERATEITHAVVRTLRALVPEEASDVAAVLPAELRELWQTETAQ